MKKELIKNMVSLIVGEALLEFIENPTSLNIVNDLREKYSEKILSAIDSMQEEPVSEDLEQAIDTYLATYFGGEKEKQDWPFLKKMAIHFANWQKEQMMKNAVSGHIGQTVNGILRVLSNEVDDELGFEAGDKVKLIIIKEE